VTFHVELSHLITGDRAHRRLFRAGEVIVWQFNKGLDARFAAQELLRLEGQKNWQQRFETIEADHRALDRAFQQHLQQLPEKYQRREDAIRQEVGIVNRLDGLASLCRDQFQVMDEKIEALRRT
jgi:hypothetical protein